MRDPTLVEPGRPRALGWRRPLGRAWRLGVRVFALIGLVLTIYHLGFEITRVSSDSMAPALRGGRERGDWVLVDRLSYRLRSPRRWEVVRFESDEGQSVMKRIAAVPGEVIGVRDGKVVINGREVAPPESLAALHYYGYGRLGAGRVHACRRGYFILGDDSKDSQDSRFEGELMPERLAGRAWLIVWPLDRVGRVTR